MLSVEQLQMGLPIHASHQSAAQLLWSASRVHFPCAIIHVHLWLSLRVKYTSSYAMACRRFRRCYFFKGPWTSFRKSGTNSQLEILHEYTLAQKVIICCNVQLIYYPGTPILNPRHTRKKIIVRIIIHA